MTSPKKHAIPFDFQNITAQDLSHETFAPYGDVIQAGLGQLGKANQGTADRFNFLANLANKRTSDNKELPEKYTNPPAPCNVCIFSIVAAPTLPFPCKLLERHYYSSQVFIPIYPNRGARAYLVIVALNDEKTDTPDFSTLKAFICKVDQGINYKPGCWHAPMIALKHHTDFLCLVHERRENAVDAVEDCEEYWFETPLQVQVPGFH